MVEDRRVLDHAGFFWPAPKGIRISTYGVFTAVRDSAVDGWFAEAFRPSTRGRAGKDERVAMTENSIAFWYHMISNDGRSLPLAMGGRVKGQVGPASRSRGGAFFISTTQPVPRS